MKPLFESDPVIKDIGTIRSNLCGEIFRLQCGDVDSEYISALEYAATVDDAKTRELLVRVASEVRYQKQKQHKTFLALENILKQVDVIRGKLEIIVSKSSSG